MRKGMTMHNETSRMAKFRFNGEEFSHIEHLTEVESDDSLPTDPYDLQWVFLQRGRARRRMGRRLLRVLHGAGPVYCPFYWHAG